MMSERFGKIKRLLMDPVFWIILVVGLLFIALIATGIFDLTDLAD